MGGIEVLRSTKIHPVSPSQGAGQAGADKAARGSPQTRAPGTSWGQAGMSAHGSGSESDLFDTKIQQPNLQERRGCSHGPYSVLLPVLLLMGPYLLCKHLLQGFIKEFARLKRNEENVSVSFAQENVGNL